MKEHLRPRILVVDDDEAICKTLSAILESEGYETTTATSAAEAIEKAKVQPFNLAILDIRLPDMEGTQLLARLQDIAPETVKIMVTGYPSLKNAVEALNLGADSYIMKPVNPAELLKRIEDKLNTQREAENTTQEKLVKWIQSQARRFKVSSFGEFLEESAADLSDFGLTKTQAKVYIAVTALRLASASEIASLSNVRREEVYRVLPELTSHGLVTEHLTAPRTFSAVPPEAAIQSLVKKKLNLMKEEVDRLEQKQQELVSKLETTNLPMEKESSSIEVIATQDNVLARLVEMTEKAKRQIDIMTSLYELKIAYANRQQELREKILRAVKMRIVVQNAELDAFTRMILQTSEVNGNPIELRMTEKLPFNLLLVDDKEAMWGEPSASNKKKAVAFWTDNPTQTSILKTCFESLWKESKRPHSGERSLQTLEERNQKMLH